MRANLLLSLQAKGFSTWGVASAEAFYREHAIRPANIILIDLGLPGEDGLSALSHLRQDNRLGIIVITARGSSEQRVAGFVAGADQYFVKPIDIQELLAAIEALWRRLSAGSGAVPPKTNLQYTSSTWHLDKSNALLIAPDGQKLLLSERELGFLSVLLANPGVVVSKAALHEHLFPDSDEIETHRIDVILSRLRQKVETQFALPLPVRTIFGKGFAFAGAD